MGLIAVEGMHFYAHHGFYREEQIIGGQFVVDVYMEANVEAAAITDSIENTINYENVYRLVKEEMEKNAKLIEHLTGNIIDRLMSDHSGIQEVKVRVSKLNPPIKGTVNRVFVELSRKR